MEERKFSVNSKSYTDKHNDIMDDLLFAYCCHRGSNINIYDEAIYIPINERGLEILEHLRDLDLIEEVLGN